MSRKIAGTAPARTTVAAAGLLLAAGLAACGSGPAGTTSSGTSFTYWTSQWQPAEIATVDKAFARAYPGMHAQGQYIASSDEYLPKVVTAVKSGTQPTVLLDQNPSDLPEIAQSGDLIPLNGKLTAQTSALYPGIRQSLFYRGHLTGWSGAGSPAHARTPDAAGATSGSNAVAAKGNAGRSTGPLRAWTRSAVTLRHGRPLTAFGRHFRPAEIVGQGGR